MAVDFGLQLGRGFRFSRMVCFWLAAMVAALVVSCTAWGKEPRSTLRIMAYNTQNLFDDHADGGEYAEFVPGGTSGWNKAAYRARLERLASIIRDQAQLPDIIVLEEIETPKVLEDLCRDFLPPGAYPIRMLQPDQGLIHIGLLSQVPVLSARSHRVWLDGESARSIWELYLGLPGRSVPQGMFNPADPEFSGLALFANHWKSKSGGEAETEALRILAARTLNQRVAEVRATCPHLDVVACGDFNEILHDPQTGTMAPRKFKRGKTDSLRGSKPAGLVEPIWALGKLSNATMEERDRLHAVIWVAPWDQRDTLVADWYSPWQGAGQDEQGNSGSYFYHGTWEAIDHFLLSASIMDDWGWAYHSFQVLNGPALLDTQGGPYRWDSRTKLGVSDHLPILLELQPKTR